VSARTQFSRSDDRQHDGSAGTLGEVLIRSRAGTMGNTSSLDDGEMRDLEIYLESL
jgi:hypothetical protein